MTLDSQIHLLELWLENIVKQPRYNNPLFLDRLCDLFSSHSICLTSFHNNVFASGYRRDFVTYVGWEYGLWGDSGLWPKGGHKSQSPDNHCGNLWSRQGANPKVYLGDVMTWEIYQVGKAEFLGRATARPHVYLEEEVNSKYDTNTSWKPDTQ